MAAAMIGGCDATPAEALPPVPPMLVQQDEIPFGDAITRRMTRAANALRDRLEPRWGALTGRIYRLPANRQADFVQQVRMGLPAGWRAQTMERAPDGTQWLVFAKGDRLVAYLLHDQRAGAVYPVQLFHN